MYAVITAGGRVSPDFARLIGTDCKALAPLRERALIDPAIDAARAIGVDAIAVVGSAAVGTHCGSRIDRLIPAAASGPENIARALRAFPHAERLVFLTSDLPFIDRAALEGFVARSTEWALTMALAPASAYDAAFPDAPPHCVRLGAQRFANGSAFVIDRSAIEPLERVAGRFFSARKSLLRLAALLGPMLCLRFAGGRLQIGDIERRASAVLGIAAHAVVDAAPELCYDIDGIGDYTDALRRLGAPG